MIEILPMRWIRRTAAAGKFYPSDPIELTNMLANLVGKHKRVHAPAIVVPHAGYIYSGAIAGEAYGRIVVPKNVILLCPNHSGKGKKISVWSEGEWECPLGNVPIQTELARYFLEAIGETEGDDKAHIYEHANEVHVPFLKFANDNVSIVPITLGGLSLENCGLVGKAIAATVALAPKDTLVVASTDMSHYLSSDQCEKKDKIALKAIESLSAQSLYQSVTQHEISMCGFIPTTCVLAAGPWIGVNRSELLRYGTSGDVTRDYSNVVAYASVILHS